MLPIQMVADVPRTKRLPMPMLADVLGPQMFSETDVYDVCGSPMFCRYLSEYMLMHKVWMSLKHDHPYNVPSIPCY